MSLSAVSSKKRVRSCAEPRTPKTVARSAGRWETNAVSVLLIRNCRRDRSLAEGVIHGCNLVSTVSGSRVCPMNSNAAGRFSSKVGRIWLGERMNPPSA